MRKLVLFRRLFDFYSITLVNSLYKFDVGFASSTARVPSGTAREEPGHWSPSHLYMRFVSHDIHLYCIILLCSTYLFIVFLIWNVIRLFIDIDLIMF